MPFFVSPLFSFKTSDYLVLVLSSTISHITCWKVTLSQFDNLLCSKMLKERTPSASKISSGIERLFSHMLLKILPKVYSLSIVRIRNSEQNYENGSRLPFAR